MSETSAIALNCRYTAETQPVGTHVASLWLHDAVIRCQERPRGMRVVAFADLRHPVARDWEECSGTRVVHVPFQTMSRARIHAWEQFCFTHAAQEAGCLVAHHPSNTAPILRQGATKHVVTVHDLNFLHHPEWTGRMFGAYLRRCAVPAIQRADAVVTVSDHVLGDVRATLGVPAERSERIYHGSEHIHRSDDDSARRRGSILAVNPWQPHKNLARLISAFTRLRGDDDTLRLRLVGRPQANFAAQPTLDPPKGVEVLGYLSEEDLRKEYETADIVCYPSVSEGFGLPVLEALAAGARVVTSSTTSLPEVGGDAAVLVDPTSAISIADGLHTLLMEPDPRAAARRERGRRHAASFRWQDAAAQYWSVFAQLGHRKR